MSSSAEVGRVLLSSSVEACWVLMSLVYDVVFCIVAGRVQLFFWCVVLAGG